MVESQHNWHGTQVSTLVVEQLLDVIFANHQGQGTTTNNDSGDNDNNNNGIDDYQSNDVAWFQQGLRMDMLTQESGSVSVPPSLQLLQWWWWRGDASSAEEEEYDEGKVENDDDKGSKEAVVLLKCVLPSNVPSFSSHDSRMTVYWNWEQQHEPDDNYEDEDGDDSDGRHHGCRCSVTILAEGTWDVVVAATQDGTSNVMDVVIATFSRLQWTMEASSSPSSSSSSWSQCDNSPSTHIPTCWKIGHIKLLFPSSYWGDASHTACGVEYTDLTLLGTIVVPNDVHDIIDDGMSSATTTTTTIPLLSSTITSIVTFHPKCLLNLTIQPTNNGHHHGLDHDLASAPPTTASATTTTAKSSSMRANMPHIGMDWWTTHLDSVTLPNVILTMTTPKTMTQTTTTPTTATVIPFVSTATTTLGDIVRHSVQYSSVWNSNEPLSHISATTDGPSRNIHQWPQPQPSSSLPPPQTRGWPSPQGGWDPMISDEAFIAPSSSSSGVDPPGEPPRNDADGNDVAAASRTGRPTISWSVGDSIAATGALVATGASIVTPLGAAVSVAALAAKDGIVAAAQKGKQARNSSSDDGYRFGDVTRGTITALRERRSRRLGSDGAILGATTRCNDDDFEPVDPETQQGPGVEAAGGVGGPVAAADDLEEQGPSTSYLRTNRHRFVGAVGGSAGAAVGLALLGGPVGILAGSIAGSVGTQTAIRRRQQQQQQQQEQEGTVTEGCVSDDNNNIRNDKATQAVAGPNPDAGESNATTKFRLGDNVRGFLAKGKEVTGREKDSRYKFGDFSRGLIASVKGRNNGNDQPDAFQS